MKFRRKSDAAAADPTDLAVDESEAARPGPHDIDDLPDDGVERVDLGALVIAPPPGVDLQLQVDEASGEVQAVILAGPDGALELRAFAAPRHGDLWGEVLPQIAADMSRRGGTATEREGLFGTELSCRLTVQQPDGTTGQQSIRMIGVNGPRWLLRATLQGRPALEDETPELWASAIRSVAVRRGTEAIPPGEPLRVVMPANARKVDG